MMKPKIRFSSDIAKDLQIVDCWLTRDNLVIQYITAGNDYTIDLTDLDAMELLKKYGLIEDYHSMMVKMVDEDGRSVWIEWQDYAMNNDFSETDAKIIACAEEESKSIDQWVSEVTSIPSLIKSIGV